IIFLDKKPMVTLFDEVSYEVVSGIQFDIHIFYATVVLHTPVKNYDIRYANMRCAERFARHIESRRLEREKVAESETEEVEELPMAEPVEYPSELIKDMAGYYWLPTE